jgi:Fic family protein
MQTLKRLSHGITALPAGTAWYLADIAEAKGKQDLFTNQSPQKLKALREHALIESAVSSNRIEGVEIDKKRIGTVIFGRPLLRDRNEEEVQGYRDALQMIHERASSIRFSQATVKQLHKLTRGDIGDAGRYKVRDGDIIERLPNGGTRVRFKTVCAARTARAMKELVSYYRQHMSENRIHPLLSVAACNLDFLCIHPFRDGNGRVSRLLLLLQLYHAGYEVGRFISLERMIEEHKERYYETLELSSKKWHSGRHDPWPYVNFVLYLLKGAYAEFGERIQRIETPRGGKTEMVIHAIARFGSAFTLSELQSRCPEVSRDMIRKVLKDLKAEGTVVSQGRGLAARWRHKG